MISSCLDFAICDSGSPKVGAEIHSHVGFNMNGRSIVVNNSVILATKGSNKE